MVPAGIAGAVLLIGGGAFALTRSGGDNPPATQVAATTSPVQATTPAVTQPVMRTDSAAGTIVSNGLSDSAAFNAIRDSIARADEARRIRRERAAAAAAAAETQRAERPRTITDSTGKVWLLDPPAGFGTNRTVTVPDTTRPRPDTSTLVLPPPTTTVPRPDSLVRPRPDTTVRPRPDTTVKPPPPTCCSI
jgi:hypothetical protein